MIAKIMSGKHFFGVAHYNQQKVDRGKGAILYHQKLRSTAPRRVAKSMERLNLTEVSKPVLHISLSFPEADEPLLNDAKMRKIAREYLQKMGYGGQPYIIYRHDDTAHPHVHILTTRVDIETQKKLPDSYEQRKSRQITDELEVKYGLHTLEKVREIKKELNHRQYVRGAIEKVLAKNPEGITAMGFVRALRQQDIRVKFQYTSPGENHHHHHSNNHQQSNHLIKGVSYQYQNRTYRGVDLSTNILANIPANIPDTSKDLSWKKVSSLIERPEGWQTYEILSNRLSSPSSEKITPRWKDGRLQFDTGNPLLNQHLESLPFEKAITLSQRYNHYLGSYLDKNLNRDLKGKVHDKVNDKEQTANQTANQTARQIKAALLALENDMEQAYPAEKRHKKKSNKKRTIG